MSIKTEIEWFRADEALPVIPEGKYGMPVLAVEFDPVYEEINPGHGYEVHEIHYMKIMDIRGIKNRHFKHSTSDAAFAVLHVDEWYPPCDEITHWAYMPKPPVTETVAKSDKQVFEEKYNLVGKGHSCKFSKKTEDAIKELNAQGKRIMESNAHIAKYDNTRYGGVKIG